MSRHLLKKQTSLMVAETGDQSAGSRHLSWEPHKSS